MSKQKTLAELNAKKEKIEQQLAVSYTHLMYRKADAHPIVNKSAHAAKCCLPCTAGTYVHSKIP